MSTRLVILGLLRERPLYGYEIKQIIEEHMGDWTSIAFGSIYFALDKLTQEGYLDNVGVEQAGSRPSRKVYQITKPGQEEFMRLLRETWEQFDRQYFALDIGIFFMGALPIQEVKGYLHKRIAMLEEVLQHLDEHQAEQMENPEVPRLAKAIFDHSLVHFQAELHWTKELLAKVEHGTYT
ncbi:MAG: PadR family transcriptional regulator [Anaerolineae bacterium]|nr:PadR family transcriptional regulator [Anaerolineae bacterium]